MASKTQNQEIARIKGRLLATEDTPIELPKLSKFDYLAGLAMQGLLANPLLDREPVGAIADRAILAAQALIDRLTWIDDPVFPPTDPPNDQLPHPYRPLPPPSPTATHQTHQTRT